VEFQEVPLGAGRREHIGRTDPASSQIFEISFISAMLTSRWVFSITLAASATLIDGAW
jgi:hypothetical protein